MRRDEHINITEQSSAELHEQLLVVWALTVTSVPVIHYSPRYTMPPIVQGYPGFLTELPRTDLEEPSQSLTTEAMGITWLAQQRQSLERFSS